MDEADPVRVVISEPADDEKNVLISITDRGLGVPPGEGQGLSGVGEQGAGVVRGWGSRAQGS